MYYISNIGEVMDVRDIKYSDSMFDLAVDKSTIDALLCGEKSFLNIAKMLKEVQRVLKDGGIYMAISYGKPENRVFHFEKEHLSFDINIFTIKKAYYMEENNENNEKVL
jgi:ubiquinone/menaquinone biosynthesis C-methylase UbiE